VRHDAETSVVACHARVPRGRGSVLRRGRAADKTKVDQATKQVEQGAKQIGQGNVGHGVKETAKGIGNTVVEGAKFSGENIKEFFQKTFGR
jgi:hypothetical protein